MGGPLNTYNVLIVDDEKELVDQWVQALRAVPDVDVVYSYDVAEALKQLKKSYFHLAIVDLDFQHTPDGTRVFKFLADFRPSCEAVLATRSEGRHQKAFFDLLNPNFPKIRSVINKVQVGDSLADVVRTKRDQWLRHRIDIDNIDLVVENLRARNKDRFKIQISRDEVDYLISRLLGQGQFPEAVDHEVKRARVELLYGGLSSSVVVKCRPSTQNGLEGIWTVIKISPRADAAEEYQRYCRFVRFLVSLQARVELLGYESADTLGAVCYSFAGKSPADITTLNDLFLKAGDYQRTADVLDRLFGPGSKFWYDIAGPPVTMEKFLSGVYALDTLEIIKGIARLFQDVNNSVAEVRARDRCLTWKSEQIIQPDGILGGADVRREFPAAIVHGDMNADNIIVGEDNRVIMIDYRHTQFSPRALDFAALECSLRLSQLASDADYASILPFHEQERLVWHSVWRGGTDPESDASDGIPYWRKISALLAQHASANFVDLTEREYAVTCLGWALRILRVKGLTDLERWRLILWASWLCHALKTAPAAAIRKSK